MSVEDLEEFLHDYLSFLCRQLRTLGLGLGIVALVLMVILFAHDGMLRLCQQMLC